MQTKAKVHYIQKYIWNEKSCKIQPFSHTLRNYSARDFDCTQWQVLHQNILHKTVKQVKLTLLRYFTVISFN